jgi:hypothetical protein
VTSDHPYNADSAARKTMRKPVINNEKWPPGRPFLVVDQGGALAQNAAQNDGYMRAWIGLRPDWRSVHGTARGGQ